MIKKKSRIDHSEAARLERVALLRSKTGKKLSALSISYLNAENLSGNIENFIGSTSLPLGLAGPLQIHFENYCEEIFAAFATSEGALVSSISRGAIAINLSNGVRTRCIENTVTRAPAFLFENLDQTVHFSRWLPTQVNELKNKIKQHSKYAQLIDVKVKVIVNEVHAIFIYTTGEAAGQNMTTLITASLLQNIKQNYFNETQYWISQIAIEGNLSSDKKVSDSLFSVGRGRKVIAEATLPNSVVKKIFKVSSYDLVKNYNRMKTARVFSGYQGFNINVANVVAALFLATGQDAACIHESSVAELHLELQGDSIFASLYMPSLVVGTIGGGTNLPHAKNCLDLMSCEGLNSADKLAQIICSYALALELSTVSAIEGGQFVQAHTALGRTSQKNFKPEDINTEFLNSMKLDADLTILSCGQLQAADFDDAMMIDLASISARRISGLFQLTAEIKNNTKIYSHDLILKIKNSDSDLILSSQMMLQNIGMSDIAESDELKKYHPFLNCQKNEILINQILAKNNFHFVPKVYVSGIKSETGFLLQAEIKNAHKKFHHWTNNDFKKCLDQLATIHSGTYEGLPQNSLDYIDSKNLWFELAEKIMTRNKSEVIQKVFRFCVKNYDNSFASFDSLQKRFCHLDYNPRNLLFSEDNIFVIDWEFSGSHLPQRDVIELLMFNPSELSAHQINLVIDDYPQKIKYPQQDWQNGMAAAFIDFVFRRLSLYIIISEFKDVHFLSDVLNNCKLFLENKLAKTE